MKRSIEESFPKEKILLYRPQPQPPGNDQLNDLGGAGEDRQAAGIPEETPDAVSPTF